MTKDIVHRLRYVFNDTDEVLEWIDTSNYCGAETYTHISGMWDAMQLAATRIEELEKSLGFCADVIKEWEKKPDGIEPFMLGALDHAYKTLGVETNVVREKTD